MSISSDFLFVSYRNKRAYRSCTLSGLQCFHLCKLLDQFTA